MAKIPKNLSDKDMLKGFVEEPTLEDVFLAKEKAAEKKSVGENPASNINIAYLTPDIVEKLGKLLLELKVKLYDAGIVDYRIEPKLEGKQIILVPVETDRKR